MKRGLVFSKYGDLAASTRQRVLQMQPYLASAGIELTIAPFFENAHLAGFFNHGTRDRAGILASYRRRFATLRHAKEYDFLWVQYELFPYLPGLFEALVKLPGKPVIVDYDDAIFHQYDEHSSLLVRLLLAGKLHPLLRRADLAFCGNRYLRDYVSRDCPRAELIPTVLDVMHYRPLAWTGVKRASGAKPVVGWIGSPTTWELHARPYAGMLSALVHAGAIEVLVIGAGSAADPSLPFTFRAWEEAREVADLQAMDIGIMPIPDEPWARGKCGYKLIQYMACGLPVIASPVGMNREIVTHGVNGYLAGNDGEWLASIKMLVSDEALRRRMGEAGRKTAEDHYSIQRYGPKIVGLVVEMLRGE